MPYHLLTNDCWPLMMYYWMMFNWWSCYICVIEEKPPETKPSYETHPQAPGDDPSKGGPPGSPTPKTLVGVPNQMPDQDGRYVELFIITTENGNVYGFILVVKVLRLSEWLISKVIHEDKQLPVGDIQTWMKGENNTWSQIHKLSSQICNSFLEYFYLL